MRAQTVTLVRSTSGLKDAQLYRQVCSDFQLGVIMLVNQRAFWQLPELMTVETTGPVVFNNGEGCFHNDKSKPNLTLTLTPRVLN